MMDEPKYKRVLLKISGEALAGDKHFGLDFQVMGQVADVIRECVAMALQAPSGSNVVTMQFVVVKDAAKRQAAGLDRGQPVSEAGDQRVQCREGVGRRLAGRTP